MKNLLKQLKVSPHRPFSCCCCCCRLRHAVVVRFSFLSFLAAAAAGGGLNACAHNTWSVSGPIEHCVLKLEAIVAPDNKMEPVERERKNFRCAS